MRKGTAQKIDEGQLTLFTLDDPKDAEEAIPEGAYRVVGDEVLAQRLDPECWAKALAGGGRTKDSALSLYAKLRAEALAENLNWKESKARALELRKLTAGAPESHFQTRIVWRKRFSLMWDFLFWQILLSVSGVGLFLALLAMGPDSRWWPGLLPLVVVSAFLQLSPVLFFALGKLIVGRVSYSQALGLTAICLISLGGYFGVQTMMGKQAPSWLVATIDKSVEMEPEEASPEPYDEEF
ncbi:hypothetical protein AAFN60_10875 [Roseibacillus persicicus]|uniref:hypothetical protein n=1 Tax=Roseibacillus persicicus TaxID=454148 RepID=UPI00398B15E3